MRLYSLVAGNYLSDLQKGLQTTHAVSDMFNDARASQDPAVYDALREWADRHKTVIILNAINHGTVVDTYTKLKPLVAKLCLPISLFHEDGESMNGMATCTALVVPEHLYAANVEYTQTMPTADQPHGCREKFYRYVKIDEKNPCRPVIEEKVYTPGMVEYELIDILKSFNLA